jgi:hypothetical protein
MKSWVSLSSAGDLFKIGAIERSFCGPEADLFIRILITGKYLFHTCLYILMYLMVENVAWSCKITDESGEISIYLLALCMTLRQRPLLQPRSETGQRFFFSQDRPSLRIQPANPPGTKKKIRVELFEEERTPSRL